MSLAVDLTSNIIPDPILVTDHAAQKVLELIKEEENPALKLRVYITGGGCSGFQYGFTFEETINAEDTAIVKSIRLSGQSPDNHDENMTLLVDPISLQYLMGAEIDYKEDLNGSQFVIRNPNAQTTCGCGSSFSV